MRSARFPSALPLLRSAWSFARKQPVLTPILLWFLIVPSTILDWLQRLGIPQNVLTSTNGVSLTDVFASLLALLLWVVTIWGWACVLFVGKRMVTNRAGRARASFRLVRRDTLPFILPLLSTVLLQCCFTFYRSLIYFIPFLLILFLAMNGWISFISRTALSHLFLILSPLLLPAFFYYIRTYFADITIFCEDIAYRAALHRSSALVHGKLLRILWILFVLALCTILPAAVITWFLDSLHAADPSVLLLTDLIGNAVGMAASVLFTLATIALYGKLRERPQEVKL